MLNAVQQRMVEESLVQKEVYDAMMRMRRNLNNLSGIESPHPEDIDLPVPSTASGEAPPSRPRSRSTDRIPGDVLATADASRTVKPGASGGPLKPYIPPTLPKEGGNPFPGLSGPMG